VQKGKKTDRLPKGNPPITQRLEALVHNVVEKGKPIAYVAKKLRIRYMVARNLIVKNSPKKASGPLEAPPEDPIPTLHGFLPLE
jgi:hypothetical protein